MPLVDLGITLGGSAGSAGVTVTAGSAASTGTTATPGTSGSTGQVDAGNPGGTAGNPGASTAGSTAGSTDPVTTALSKVAWAMQLSEAIYLNERRTAGPGAWVTYKVVYLFADGNAVLVKEPDCVAYTGPLLVARNLRRAGEVYLDG